MSIWDDPEMKVNDDYIKFESVGDAVTGKIIDIRAHRFDDGKVVPQLLLDVGGEEKTLTAGQVRLKAALTEKRPNVGDVLTVKLTEIEKRSGGKTLKHFDVQVGGASTPAAEPAAASVPTTAGELSDEQRAALAALNL